MFKSSVAPCAIIAFLLLQAVQFVAALAIERRGITCNGHVELCGRQYSNVTFLGAHDSFAVGATDVAANQDYNVTQQLNDGIRMLQNQVLVQPDGLHLCHTICPLYDAGLLLNYLVEVRNWLAKNPTEVVSILLVNINGASPVQFAEVYENAGLVEYVFAPQTPTLTVNQWPTLGTMIANNQRLVTFMDNKANSSEVPYIMDEFTNVWEDAFDATTTEWSCEVNRTRGDPTTHLYLINHFLDDPTSVLGEAETTSPAKEKLNTTNAATGPGSIGPHIDNCLALHSVPPNFVLLDFYDYGNGGPFEVAARLNGLPAPTTHPSPPTAQEDTNPDSGSIIVSTRPLNGASSGHVHRTLLLLAGLFVVLSCL